MSRGFPELGGRHRDRPVQHATEQLSCSFLALHPLLLFSALKLLKAGSEQAAAHLHRKFQLLKAVGFLIVHKALLAVHKADLLLCIRSLTLHVKQCIASFEHCTNAQMCWCKQLNHAMCTEAYVQQVCNRQVASSRLQKEPDILAALLTAHVAEQLLRKRQAFNIPECVSPEAQPPSW